jgi:hypothetical protein
VVLLLGVGVVAAVALLNLWLAVAIGAGLLLGELVRRLLRLLGRLSTRGKIATCVSVVGLIFGAIAAVLAVFVDFVDEDGPGAVAVWERPYVVQARYIDDHFVVREQVHLSDSDANQLAARSFGDLGVIVSRRLRPMGWLLRHYKLKTLVLVGASPAELIEAGADPETVIRLVGQRPRALRRVISAAVVRDGWGRVEVRENGFVVHHRPLTIERPIRVWPLTTDLSLPIPQLAFWVASVEPDHTTKIDLFAAPRVFKQTSPPSSEEYWNGQVTRRRIVLDDASDLSGDTAKVRIEANSVLARNPVVAQVRDWTVWTPILWLATLISAILSDTIKGWITRLLRLGKRKETPRASEATTT